MRYPTILSLLLLCPAVTVSAQVSVGIELPGLSIGINQPVYPELVPVPGYPVYYAPQSEANYFFYDGLYWVYQGNDWYASSWYNGPWERVGPEEVPLFVLRVPLRYYRRPPQEFMGWRRDQAPRWGEHWGQDWEQRRRGWDRWDHRSAPPRAELPRYQREYSGDRYPRDARQQQVLHGERYHYQPREAVTREHYQHERAQSPGPQRGNPEQHQRGNPGQGGQFPQSPTQSTDHQQDRPGQGPRSQSTDHQQDRPGQGPRSQSTDHQQDNPGQGPQHQQPGRPAQQPPQQGRPQQPQQPPQQGRPQQPQQPPQQGRPQQPQQPPQQGRPQQPQQPPQRNPGNGAPQGGRPAQQPAQEHGNPHQGQGPQGQNPKHEDKKVREPG